MEDYKALPFDQLRTLHREIGALIAQRRHEALDQLKEQIAVLGFSVDDLVPKKRKASGLAAVRYRDPEVPDHVWSGRGKHPAWLRDKLQEGHTLEEFLIRSG
jgi:DNA-binding protein H-NS